MEEIEHTVGEDKRPRERGDARREITLRAKLRFKGRRLARGAQPWVLVTGS